MRKILYLLLLCLMSAVFAEEPQNSSSTQQNQEDPEHEGEGVSPQAAGSEELKSEKPDKALTEEGRATGDWCGWRSCLEKKGIAFRSTLVVDSSWNLLGGRKASIDPALQYWFDANLTVTSEALFTTRGGTFFIDFQSHHGEGPRDKLVGSVIAVDTLEARDLDQLASLWYRQTFGKKDKNWILIGKSDAYDNFTRTEHSILFLNGAFNSLPTIAFFPTYPEPAMSVVAHLDLCSSTDITCGLFDGSLARGIQTGAAGPFGHFFNHLDRHAFLIGELNLHWTLPKEREGRCGIGAWYHTAKIARFDDTWQKSTAGPYLTFDQILYKKKEQTVALFALAGKSNPQVNPIAAYIGAGLIWEGAFDRPLDALGIAFSQGHFSHAKASHFKRSTETFIEFLYKWQFCSWMYLEPDFQYVIHPGGKDLPNAAVITLRLQANI